MITKMDILETKLDLQARTIRKTQTVVKVLNDSEIDPDAASKITAALMEILDGIDWSMDDLEEKLKKEDND